MDYQKILEELYNLLEQNTEESNNKIITLIDQTINDVPSNTSIIFNNKDELKDIKKSLKYIRERAVINLLEINYSNVSGKKELIHLEGKLIKEYKKLESLDESNKKYEIRDKIDKLLDNQKKLIKDYRQSSSNISLPEKVFLKTKEISNTISVFLSKKDIITKVKNVFKDTVVSGVSSIALANAVSIGVGLVTGLPLGLIGVGSFAPIIGYSLIASSIRNASSKTPYQKYEYFISDEYKEYVSNFENDNKDLLEDYNKLLDKKNSTSNIEDRISMNEELIKRMDLISNKISIKEYRYLYAIQSLALERENKELCKSIINDYLDEKNNDREKYKLYNDKLSKINIQIFTRENSIKDAIKSSSKNAIKNASVMALAKTIVTAVVPSSTLAIHGVESFILPVAIAISNGLVEIPTYNGKLKYKETSENKKIDVKEKDKFMNLFNKNDLQVSRSFV